MLLIKLSRDARKQGKKTFWRCGVEHSLEGAPFPAGAFSAAEWATLRAEPMLEVTEVPDDAVPAPTPEEAAAGLRAQLRAQVRAAIAGLSAEEFTKAGAPQPGAIRAVIPEAGSAALKSVLTEVWAEMTAEGFVAPVAPEPVPPAGAAQDDAGAPKEA